MHAVRPLPEQRMKAVEALFGAGCSQCLRDAVRPLPEQRMKGVGALVCAGCSQCLQRGQQLEDLARRATDQAGVLQRRLLLSTCACNMWVIYDVYARMCIT